MQELRSGLPFTPAPNEREAKQVSKSLNTSGVSDTPLKTSSVDSTTKQNQSEVFPKRKELENSQFTDTKGEIDDTITRNSTDNANNSNISNTNTLDSHLLTTPQGNERVMGDISTQSRVHREGGLRESTQLQDISFKDTKGKEHTLTKETQEQWLKTFELENLEQSYIPKHSEAIKEALGGKEIRLQKGSLLKLVSQGRQDYIPQIKAVLDEPDLIIKEPSEEILLAKHLRDEDYFVNVSFNNGEYLVSISNGIKETRNLQNKLNAGAKIIYQSPNANSISQTLLQTSQYSANKIDNVDSTTNLSKEQIPQERYKQTLKEIEEQEQYYHNLDYKPSIKPILDNLQKEFKNNDYAILKWKERNNIGKMVVKKTNFRSHKDIKNTLQAYEDYAKAGNDALREIEAIQKSTQRYRCTIYQKRTSKTRSTTSLR